MSHIKGETALEPLTSVFNVNARFARSTFRPPTPNPYARPYSIRGNEHTKSGKHPNCSQACPEFGLSRRGIEGLRDATIAEKYRATIMYSQAFHSSEVKNKAMLQWYERVQEGNVFHGAWLGLFNSAPTFPKFADSAFSDGALGPPSTAAWAQFPRQYEDIPTQFNQNIRHFDLQAAKAGNPAFGPGTQISTTPLILSAPSTSPLTVSVPAPAPTSSSNVPAPAPTSSSNASGSGSNAPIPPASTTAAPSVPFTPSSPLMLTAPAPSTSSNASGSGSNAPIPPASTSSLLFQQTYTFKMPEPENLRPLQSTWNSEGKELPKRVLFVLSKMQAAKKPLKNLKSADEAVVGNFYWCIIQWDLVSPRRVQFLRLLERSTTLQHYMWVDHSLGLKRCDIYLFEWITLALELNDAGVQVAFIDNDDFLECLEKRELSKYWGLLRSIDLVIGRADLHPSSIPPQNIYSGNLRETIKVLTAMGIRIWPESEVDHFTRKKFALHGLLAPIIEKAGGLAEAPVRVTSTTQGQTFLESGEWIIKMEYSDEGKYVYRTTDSVEKFVKDFKSYHPARLFYAIRYNPALILRGEVRVYIAFGELLQMVHTQPQPGLDEYYKGPDHWKLTSAEHCYGFLTPVEEIQPSYRPGPTSWESQSNPERLWYHRDGPVGRLGKNGKSGTDQLLDFISKIYYRLIQLEDILYRGVDHPTSFQPSIASLRLLCRIDVGIIWDDRVPSEARYRFIVNEVQEGMCGLMMMGKDSRGAIPKGIVQALKRGALLG
ncbi:hypothetical protein C8J55DRAFT_561969 [Lentinula edodes]|uniref:Uncharacterized protein n=1 Tax=Lentinula lateritia TaxID=40482 RepID=A0A9W9DLD5_9AGAR|nr:hypothetical protein C8J55DRAFT_561969 [Lentinula edodes]